MWDSNTAFATKWFWGRDVSILDLNLLEIFLNSDKVASQGKVQSTITGLDGAFLWGVCMFSLGCVSSGYYGFPHQHQKQCWVPPGGSRRQMFVHVDSAYSILLLIFIDSISLGNPFLCLDPAFENQCSAVLMYAAADPWKALMWTLKVLEFDFCYFCMHAESKWEMYFMCYVCNIFTNMDCVTLTDMIQ